SALHIGIRIYLSTDWELQPEELDNTAIHLDDSEDEVIQPKVGNPMNVYRISTDLDLSKGEASLLDGENGGDLTKLSTGKPQQLDSGVGS
ncbi:unnamed protein product, partial [Allacma fusca]